MMYSAKKHPFAVALGISMVLHAAAFVFLPSFQPSNHVPARNPADISFETVTITPEPPAAPPPLIQVARAPVPAPQIVSQPAPTPLPKAQRVKIKKPVIPAQVPAAPPPEQPLLAFNQWSPNYAPVTDHSSLPSELKDDLVPLEPGQAAASPVAAPFPHTGNAGIPGGTGFVPPAYCRCSLPAYPAEAKRKGQEGTVRLYLRLNEYGTVESVKLKDSSGVASLDKAALHAVKEWQFLPARTNGIPTAHEVEVPVRFALKDSKT